MSSASEQAEQFDFSERAEFSAKGLYEFARDFGHGRHFSGNEDPRSSGYARRREARELGVVSDGDHDMSVARGECLIGYDVGVSIARRCGAVPDARKFIP